MAQIDVFTAAIRSVQAACAKKAHQKDMFPVNNVPNPTVHRTAFGSPCSHRAQTSLLHVLRDRHVARARSAEEPLSGSP